MKISSVSNVSFKDRQIEEFGETIITSPKTTQLDENKYWLFADKQAQINKALLLAQITPELESPYQYWIKHNDPKSDIDFTIKETKDFVRGVEVTRATGFKNGSLYTYSGWYGAIDQELIKDNNGLVQKWRFNNWAGIKSATFYPTGELRNIEFGPNYETIPTLDDESSFDCLLERQELKPDTIYFYKNGNVSQEIYVNKMVDAKDNYAGSITLIKGYDKDSGKLINLQVHYEQLPPHGDEYKYVVKDYSNNIHWQPEYVIRPYDWQSMIPDELQEVIDENKRIAEELNK